jgi:hypothetical protein
MFYLVLVYVWFSQLSFIHYFLLFLFNLSVMTFMFLLGLLFLYSMSPLYLLFTFINAHVV